MSDKGTKTYRYFVDGSDVNGEAFQITGYVDAVAGDVWTKVPEVIGSEVFIQLTNGKAVFGKPGLTCKGPYTIDTITIKLRKE